MENKIPFRFFVVTFLWSWVFWGALIIPGMLNLPISNDYFQAISLPLMIIGAFGPAVGAIISVYTIGGKSSVKSFLSRFLSLRFGLKTWLAIFFVLGGASIIAWLLPEFFGADRIQTFFPSVFVFPLYIIITIFFGGGQEEIGWRGYISPYLEKKFGLIVGGLILGAIWAIWHLPLWFIAGSSQAYMNFFGFMLKTIGYSYFFSWVIKESGNRLFSGLVAHGVANAFVPLFPWIILADNVKQTRFWIHGIIIIIIGITIVITRTYKNREI